MAGTLLDLQLRPPYRPGEAPVRVQKVAIVTIGPTFVGGRWVGWVGRGWPGGGPRGPGAWFRRPWGPVTASWAYRESKSCSTPRGENGSGRSKFGLRVPGSRLGFRRGFVVEKAGKNLFGRKSEFFELFRAREPGRDRRFDGFWSKFEVEISDGAGRPPRVAV